MQKESSHVIARIQTRGQNLVVRSSSEGVVYDITSADNEFSGLSLQQLRLRSPELSTLVEYGYAQRGSSLDQDRPYLDASRTYPSRSQRTPVEQQASTGTHIRRNLPY